MPAKTVYPFTLAGHQVLFVADRPDIPGKVSRLPNRILAEMKTESKLRDYLAFCLGVPRPQIVINGFAPERPVFEQLPETLDGA